MDITISKANSKLVKLIKVDEFSGVRKAHIASFGIPAGTTCPGKGMCYAVCYALQGAYRWEAARKVRASNYLATLKESFAEDMILAISEKKYRIFRIHDSGDFYSQEYINAWRKITLAFPDIIFYAYTKSVTSDFSGFPTNFRLTYSEGGKWDSKIPKGVSNARIFSTAQDRDRAGYIDGDKSDAPAIRGDKNIGFVYHGVAKLTTAQTRAFAGVK